MLVELTMMLAIVLGAPNGTRPPEAGAAAFQRLKSLVGEWRGNRPDWREIGVTYRLSALGTVLVETWNLGPQRETLTIYHMDGGDLMATHFCPQGNQPRLKLTGASVNRFDFSFHDVTGVQPGQLVQHGFWIKVEADGAVTRSETYTNGNVNESETVAYRRVRE